MATLFRPGTVLRVVQNAYFINTRECGEGTFEPIFVPALGEVVVVGWSIGRYRGRLPGGFQMFLLLDHLCIRDKATGKTGTGWPVAVLR